MLASALNDHESALRASLRAEYGIDLRAELSRPDVVLTDLADLVAWLPPGCAFWRSFGGPNALTEEVHALTAIEFRLRVADWRETKGSKPKPPQVPPYAHETKAVRASQRRKADRFSRRQQKK
jgi:hypothetical protein